MRRKKIQVERLDNDTYLITDWPILSERLRSYATVGEMVAVVLAEVLPLTEPIEARDWIIARVALLANDLWKEKVKRVRHI